MIGGQKQSAEDGSIAVQAAGDVTISQGLTSVQMVEILSALSSHVNTLVSSTREEMEGRLKSLEESIIERFATDSTTRAEAFRDPDFLAATLDAQKAFARSGEDGLKTMLTDLVAQRSKNTSRNRLTLTLNDAIQKVGSIPQSDLNTLSLIFLLKNVKHNGLVNLEGLAEFLSDSATSLLDDVSISESAFNYLAAHGCLLPLGIGEYSSALEFLIKTYGQLVTKGETEENFRNVFSDYDILTWAGLIVDSPYGRGLKRFSIAGSEMAKILGQIGVFGDHAERYATLVASAMPSKEEFIEVMSVHFPRVDDFLSIYNETVFRSSRLTSIGIALAHANLKTSPFLETDLSVWITP